MAQVTESIQARGLRFSDQAEVWADIAAKSERLSVHSSTGAMEEIFLRHDEFTQRCVDALNPVAQQCGALFLIDGRVVGFDLFDRAITLRRLLPKLVRSVALDALDRAMPAAPFVPKADRRTRARGDGAVSPATLAKVAEHFLERTSQAAVHEAEAIGLGRDLRLVDPQISGAALNVDDALLHLSAFHI
jgi:hypothetical protein